jgi:hypothetical protein
VIDEAVIAFMGRGLATALLIIIVARVAERVGPFIASTIVTLPLFAGPSFFFILGEVSPEFIAVSALFAFAGAGAVISFSAGYVVAVQRLPLLASLAVASAAWFALAIPIRLVPLDLGTAFAWCAAGGLIAWIGRRPVDFHSRPPSGRSGWGPLIARAFIAGLAVATVSAVASHLGARATGLVVAFPLTLSVSTWLVYRQYGAQFSASMIAATQRTLLSYASFCLVLSLLSVPIGTSLAFAWATAAAVTSASLLAGFGLYTQRRRERH